MNYINSSNHNFFNYLILILFSLLPISLILGNLAININIICLNISLIIYSIIFNDWRWAKSKLFKSLILIQIYLIFNSIYAITFKIDYEYIYQGLFRSLGFIKYILLVFSFSLIFKFKLNFTSIVKVWSIVVFITIFDVFFEKFFGHNIFGFISPDHSRVVSFFKNEMVVGAFLLLFGLISSTYFLDLKDKIRIYKILFNILIILLPITIFITGERSNFIRTIIILSIIFIFIPNKKFFIDKKKTLLILFIGIFLLFNFNQNIKQKYTEFFERISVSKNNNSKDLFENIIYFSHYDVAWKIFKENPLLGVGSKNFRWDCHKKKYFNKDKKYSLQRCSTHPHQIHFELLSEQGLIGYFLILGILLNYVLKALYGAYKKVEIFKFSISLYILVYLLPLLPSGSMFSTFSGSNLWIMLSILYYLEEIKKDENFKKNI